MIDDGFTRHTFDSKDDLPPWFLDDETKHYKSNVPITKEAVEQLKAKQRALDARPIRKIAEAKARKQRRAAIRIEKALKKADGIVKFVRAPPLSAFVTLWLMGRLLLAATTTSRRGRRPARSRRSCARVSRRTSASPWPLSSVAVSTRALKECVATSVPRMLRGR